MVWLISGGAFAFGVLVGLVVRRVDASIWRHRAVQMAMMNDVLMNRMELLEGERQKE